MGLAQRIQRWLTKLRLILVGHEELTAIVFWAALIGIGGALASVAFRELIHALEWAITGTSGGLVAAASGLDRIHRVIVPVLGGVAAGLVIQLGAAWVYAKRPVDYMEAVAVGDGMIAARPTLIRSISSLLTIASGGSIGREGPMVQLAALIGSKVGQTQKGSDYRDGDCSSPAAPPPASRRPTMRRSRARCSWPKSSWAPLPWRVSARCWSLR